MYRQGIHVLLYYLLKYMQTKGFVIRKHLYIFRNSNNECLYNNVLGNVKFSKWPGKCNWKLS